MHIDSILTQIGSKKEKKTGAINYPVYFATAYRHSGIGESTGYDYSRTANPTRDVLEDAIAELEQGDAGFACSSGMAAIQTVIALFSKGDHLIVSLDLYGGSYRLFEQVITQYGLTFSYVDLRDEEAILQAIRPETKAIFVETPTNPLMRITNLKRISQIAEQHNLLHIVDNTFMTPYLQQPLTLGADIVLHSATKYLGGHNDVLAGFIVTKGEELTERMGFLHNSIGAVLAPLDAWLLMRGMKTLAIRMERHQQNAYQLAAYLKDHPLVDEVFYPAFHPSNEREIHEKQAKGFGGMLSFRVKDEAIIDSFLRSLQLISFAESLGGVESLITYPVTQTHADIPEEMRRKIGICNRLLRLSVGIEHIDDLKQDLEQALKRGGGK